VPEVKWRSYKSTEKEVLTRLPELLETATRTANPQFPHPTPLQQLRGQQILEILVKKYGRMAEIGKELLRILDERLGFRHINHGDLVGVIAET
jgi:hypothetical protein